MKTYQEKLAAVREAITKVVPDVATRESQGDGQGGFEPCIDTIRLSDVLRALAIDNPSQAYVHSNGYLTRYNTDKAGVMYDLRNDSLDSQSEELISYLYEILCTQ